MRQLFGDALIALGELVRGGSANVDVWAGEYAVSAGRMESDGPDLTKPIPRDEVRCALDELPDSQLLNIAATVLGGWKPILLSTAASALTDVDVLIEALRDRAAQFRAVEDDAREPWLSTTHLGAHLTRSAQSRPE